MRCDKLPHPDTFTQAPICCLYFFDHLMDVALLDRHFFSKSYGKRSVICVQLTCSSRPRASLTVASHSPGSLGFPGNSGSRDTPPIGVFSTPALSCSALDRRRLGGVLYLQHSSKNHRSSAQLSFYRLGSSNPLLPLQVIAFLG